MGYIIVRVIMPLENLKSIIKDEKWLTRMRYFFPTVFESDTHCQK